VRVRAPKKHWGPRDVARRYNVPLRVAYWWCLTNNFLPGCWQDAGSKLWHIPLRYAVIDPTSRPFALEPARRGRPPGKAKKPYPKGVKRPRKAKVEQAQASQ